MKNGTGKVVIDMSKIIMQAKICGVKKPAQVINLSHLASWRNKTDQFTSKPDIAKIEVLQSFCRIRELIQQELDQISGC